MSEGSTVDPAASAPGHSPAEDGEPPSNGPTNDSASYGIDTLHRNSSVDVFRTCADPGIYTSAQFCVRFIDTHDMY